MSNSRSVHLSSSNRFWWVRLAVLAVVATVVTQTGCNVIRSFDENAALTFRDMVWSKRAYNLRYGNCNRPYSEHFKNGFCDGYSDVSQGGDGYTPALPPETYRGYEFQSSDGSKCVDAWFEGYPAGVAAARKDKSGSFHDLAVSRMLADAIKQQDSKPKATGKVPVVSGRKVADKNEPPMPTQYQPPAMSMRRQFVPGFGNEMPSVLADEPNSKARSMVPPVVPAGFTVSPDALDMPIPISSASSWNDQ